MSGGAEALPGARRRRGDRGGVLLLTAVVLPVLLLMAAMAVDLGTQRASRRTMQARADVIALDLSRLIDGRTLTTITSDASTEQAISASAARNDVARAKITVEWGTVAGASNTFTKSILGTAVPTAVKVTAAESVRKIFRGGSRSTRRSAVAISTGVAGFEVGSKLASVDTSQANLLNGLINGVLHSNLALSAATYQGVLGSSVNLGQLATQLGFASPSQLASSTVKAKDFYVAAASVLNANGQTAAATLFNNMALQTNQTVDLPVGKLITVGAGGDAPAARAGLDVMNLLTGSLYAINGSSAISIPNVGVTIPNVSVTNLSLNVIQAPAWAFGPVGTSVKTSQASLSFTTTVPGFTILGLLNVVGSVNLTQSVAGATGTLTNISCGSTKSITVGVASQAVTTKLTPSLNINTLLGIPVAKTSTSLSVAPNGYGNPGTFLYPSQFLPPVGTGTMQASSTSPLGLNGLVSLGATDLTLLGVLPLGTTLSGIASAINTNLLTGATGVLAKLDSLVTGPLSKALGLDIAGADLGALDMTCQNPTLVG